MPKHFTAGRSKLAKQTPMATRSQVLDFRRRGAPLAAAVDDAGLLRRKVVSSSLSLVLSAKGFMAACVRARRRRSS